MASGATGLSQMNIRLDAQTKASGDAVLRRMSITPSELVRAVWAKIAEGVEGCEQVLAALQPQKASAQGAESEGEAFIARIEARQAALLALAGDAAHPATMTDDELDDALWEEWEQRDRERGVL